MNLRTLNKKMSCDQQKVLAHLVNSYSICGVPYGLCVHRGGCMKHPVCPYCRESVLHQFDCHLKRPCRICGCQFFRDGRAHLDDCRNAITACVMCDEFYFTGHHEKCEKK